MPSCPGAQLLSRTRETGQLTRCIFMRANLHRGSKGNSGVSVSPARLVDELLQPRFDLVIGEESHVPRVGNRQAVPVSQQGRPRLHTHTTHTEEGTHQKGQPLHGWVQVILQNPGFCGSTCSNHGVCFNKWEVKPPQAFQSFHHLI